MDGVSPAPGFGAAPRLGKRRPDALLLRLLVYVEYGLLYVVAVVLLGLGCGVLGRSGTCSVVRRRGRNDSSASWKSSCS
jgi:hypothetical protein